MMDLFAPLTPAISKLENVFTLLTIALVESNAKATLIAFNGPSKLKSTSNAKPLTAIMFKNLASSLINWTKTSAHPKIQCVLFVKLKTHAKPQNVFSIKTIKQVV